MPVNKGANKGADKFANNVANECVKKSPNRIAYKGANKDQFRYQCRCLNN